MSHIPAIPPAADTQVNTGPSLHHMAFYSVYAEDIGPDGKGLGTVDDKLDVLAVIKQQTGDQIQVEGILVSGADFDGVEVPESAFHSIETEVSRTLTIEGPDGSEMVMGHEITFPHVRFDTDANGKLDTPIMHASGERETTSVVMDAMENYSFLKGFSDEFSSKYSYDPIRERPFLMPEGYQEGIESYLKTFVIPGTELAMVEMENSEVAEDQTYATYARNYYHIDMNDDGQEDAVMQAVTANSAEPTRVHYPVVLSPVIDEAYFVFQTDGSPEGFENTLEQLLDFIAPDDGTDPDAVEPLEPAPGPDSLPNSSDPES